MGSNLSLLDSGFRFLTRPFGAAARVGARIYNYSEEQKARTSWALYRPSVIWAYFLYWSSSLLFIMYFGMMCGIALTPVFAAGWPGGVWLAGALFWRLGLEPVKMLFVELGRIGKWVTLAVTPHVIFLAVYNANTANGSQPAMDSLLKNYENAAVTFNLWLEPIADLPWYWWALFAVSILALTWILSRPAILRFSLGLQKALQTVIFAAAVTASIGFSYTMPGLNWEPSVQTRLEAHLKDKLRYETEIQMSAAVEEWFKADPSRARPVAELAKNYRLVLGEAKLSSEAYSAEEIEQALRKSARSLPPEKVLETPPAALGKRKIPGSASELLELDAKIAFGNKALMLKAGEARAAAVAVISQLANVAVDTVPLLKEVLSEMIDVAAEHAGQQLLDSLPIEKGIKAVQGSEDVVKVAVASEASHIGPRIFRTEEAVLGSAASVGLAALREGFFTHAKGIKALKVRPAKVKFFRIPL
jgi:hypothetical protein